MKCFTVFFFTEKNFNEKLFSSLFTSYVLKCYQNCVRFREKAFQSLYTLYIEVQNVLKISVI